MKFMKIYIVNICFLLILPLSAEGKRPVEKGHFLTVNPNIKNEDLKGELEALKLDFDFERQKIQDFYTKEIERLKEERRSEEKALKKQFSEQRTILLTKHGADSKLDRLQPMQTNSSGKKSIRKPK